MKARSLGYILPKNRSEPFRTLSQWIGHQRFIYNAKFRKIVIFGSSKAILVFGWEDSL